MTRQDFIDNVNDFDELIGFCNDYECDLCEDVYCETSRDEDIDANLRDIAYNADGWQDLLDTLSSIVTGYDWYRRDGYDDWEGLDDYEFEQYKQDVLEWADGNAVWEEDEEETLPEDEDDNDDFVVADEPISVGELMGICSGQLQQIGDDKKAKDAAEDEAFEVFVTGCVTIVEGE